MVKLFLFYSSSLRSSLCSYLVFSPLLSSSPLFLRYMWYGLSILNEDEHGIHPEGGIAYNTCFDAVR